MTRRPSRSNQRSVTRRTLLAGVGAALTAGCTGRIPVAGNDGPITSKSLATVTPEKLKLKGPLVVEWDAEENRVVVTGHIAYGSSSCNRPELKSTFYDVGNDVLRVVVGVGEQSNSPFEFSEVCTADMASAHYRAFVRFRDSLPETVKVVERGHESNASRKRTVNRAEQRELCSVDHEQGSERAAKAHWTCPNP